MKRARHHSRRTRTPLYSSWNTHIQSHWGKATWDALFLLAADYPHEQACTDDTKYTPEEIAVRKHSWKHLFKALPGVLSCPLCGEHFSALHAAGRRAAV
jgi:hypothetical protein